jgi:hypothetical protein
VRERETERERESHSKSFYSLPKYFFYFLSSTQLDATIGKKLTKKKKLFIFAKI